MNKTQRVVMKKQNEVSVGLREARSHGPLKTVCATRRARMGAALFVALAPVSLLAVSQVASAALIDNLASVPNERAKVYSSQVREALSTVGSSAAASGSGTTEGLEARWQRGVRDEEARPEARHKDAG